MSGEFGSLLLTDLVVEDTIFLSDLSYNNATTYQLVNATPTPEILEIDFNPIDGNAAALDGKYFKIYPFNFISMEPFNDVYFWYDIGPGGSGNPSPPGLGEGLSIGINPSDSADEVHDSTRGAIGFAFSEGGEFNLSAEGGTVLTITNTANGDATDPVNDPTSPISVVVTQQGSSLSGIQPVIVPPIEGPFDTSTVMITQCPALGNITSVDMITGNVTYEPPETSGSDIYVYTMVDNNGFTRTITQTMSQVPTGMPPIANNSCDVAFLDLSLGPSNMQTYGPFNLSAMAGDAPIDWNTITVQTFQIYLPTSGDLGPGGWSCSNDYSADFGTSPSSDGNWFDDFNTWDQTNPSSPPTARLIKDFPSPADILVIWENNGDGTFDITVDGTASMSGNFPVTYIGIKVSYTVDDTNGLTSNSAISRLFIENLD